MNEKSKSAFARHVRAAKPRAKRYDVWDDVITGLGLRIGTSRHRSFFLSLEVRGRVRSATIGSADTMTVPQACAGARRLIATFIKPARKDNSPRPRIARFLDTDKLARLRRTLDNHKARWPEAVATIACSRLPAAATAKCSLCAGGTSAQTP